MEINVKVSEETMLELLKRDEKITKDEIGLIMNLSEREVRKVISELSKENPIISYSSSKGYRLAKEVSNLTEDDYEKELQELEHTKKELVSRIRELRKRLLPIISRIQEIQKLIEEE